MKNTKFKVTAWLAGFTLLLAAALTIVLLWPSPLMPAQMCDAATGQVLTTSDFSHVPPQVAADAKSLAEVYYPKDAARADDMAGQLVGTYLAAENKDYIVIFNPGGWGWDPLSDIPGWYSIMRGIQDTLSGYGYSSLLLDYKRTRHGFDGIVDETENLIGVQPEKAQELAARVSFLTQHLPDLRVILTGESNGAAISDDAMRLLQDNSRVFNIETGPPVWHASLEFARSLVIKNNGEQADAFSNGNFILILRSNLESAFGIYRGASGNILLYIGAPGHYYSWDYTAVREQVTNFIAQEVVSTSAQ